MAPRVLLVDGNSLIHRAYHALPPLSTTDGQPTNAAFGFAQMVLALLQAEQPDVAVLALDPPGPTFRHELDEQYKANRPEMDPQLAAQLGIIRELAQRMGLVVCEVPGFEADDVIGSLARRAEEQGAEVLIVSGDRDMVQLVGPRTRVMATVKGIKQTVTYDEATAQEEFGVPPKALPDLKGLAGDSSDNIPGVPQVGPKTALKLITQFGSLEALFEHLDDLPDVKLRTRLREHEDLARSSKRLATIDAHAPVPDDVLAQRWQGLDLPGLRQLLARLEFSSLLERLPPALVQERVRRVEGAAAVADLCSKARNAGVVGLALAAADERATGLGLALGDGVPMFLPLPGPAVEGGLFGQETGTAPAPCLRDLLADPAVPKVGHDLKGMARALAAVGLPLEGFGFDTSLAAYLIAPHRGDQGLEALAAQHFGESLPSAEGDHGAAARAAASAAVALRLREPLLAELDRIGARELFETVEMPLAVILRDMEAAGIAVDTQRLEEIGDQLAGMTLALSERVRRLAGVDFNLDSPKQLAQVLFERLGLPRGRRTKTGWSTNAEVLEELAADHEIVALVLSYREYAKLKSTYVDGLIRLVSPADGRVHTVFEQTVAATGRLSSRNPNLQNIPIRTDWGREIRSCFVAQGPDTVLLTADYSQIELRILAHMSQDEALLAAFRAGQDIHRTTAAAIFGTDVQSVTSDMRRTAKTVNYAVIYGMGSVALARQLGVSRAEAQRFIDSYFAHLPRVKVCMDSLVEQGRRQGYVTTLFGRRRPMPDLHSSDPRTRSYAERAAANAPLQGTAADIIKIAMVRLAPRLHDAAPSCRMLLQVHDELVFEVAAAEAVRAAHLVREVMESAAALDVPLVVEPRVGPNWRDVEPLIE